MKEKIITQKKMRFEFIEGEGENLVEYRLICYKDNVNFFIDLNKDTDVMEFLNSYTYLTAHNKITFSGVELNLYEFSEVCKQMFQRIQNLFMEDQKWAKNACL